MSKKSETAATVGLIALGVLSIAFCVGSVINIKNQTVNKINDTIDDSFHEVTVELENDLQEIKNSHDRMFRILQKSYYKENCMNPEDKDKEVCNPEYYGDLIDEINSET